MPGLGYLRVAQVCCPHHPEAPLIEDSRAGDQICPECGLVVGDRVIDVGAEWRTFSGEAGGEDRSRVGPTENPLLSSDLSTITGPSGPSPPGAKHSFSPQFSRNSQSSSDRSVTSAFRTMADMADRINLSSCVLEKASSLYKTVSEGKEGSGRGWSSEATAAACLYIACRQEDVPRTFKEITAVSSVTKTKIQRCFKKIQEKFNLNNEAKLGSAEDYLARFCGQLSLSREVEMLATRVAGRVVELSLLPGRSPLSVAAAVIYLASQVSRQTRSLAEIAERTGVSASAISASYKLISVREELFLPPV